MRIFNVMMSRDLGGIQQAYVDYHNALTMQKHEVINITSVSAQINQQLANNYSLLNLAPWCFLSKLLNIALTEAFSDWVKCRQIAFNSGSNSGYFFK